MRRSDMKDVIVIGIAGGTGSGKSTLVKKIKEEFNDRTTILSHDFYYKQHNDITFEQRKNSTMTTRIPLIRI